MSHLNYFSPYQSKAKHHEDQLTRAFLVVLRYCPVALASFMEIIRHELREADFFPSLMLEDVSLGFLETQVATLPVDEVSDLVAIMMTDENWKENMEVGIRESNARYDGVIRIGSILITIENKPCSRNIWKDQISPALPPNSGIRVHKQGVVLYWPRVIEMLGSLRSRDFTGHTGSILIDDFLSFVQENFPLLNPYHNFEQCQGNEDLLKLRCKSMMESIAPDAVRYHQGAGYCIEVVPGSAKLIYLRPKEQFICLSIYPGDTMRQAKEFYSVLDIRQLLDLEARGWKVAQNLHFSHIEKHMHWSSSEIAIGAYARYWKKHPEMIGQVKKRQFKEYFDKLREAHLITAEDRVSLDTIFGESSRQKMNPCPGIFLEYRWPLTNAESLDKDNKFAEEMKLKIAECLEVFNQSFKPVKNAQGL